MFNSFNVWYKKAQERENENMEKSKKSDLIIIRKVREKSLLICSDRHADRRENKSKDEKY